MLNGRSSRTVRDAILPALTPTSRVERSRPRVARAAGERYGASGAAGTRVPRPPGRKAALGTVMTRAWHRTTAGGVIRAERSSGARRAVAGGTLPQFARPREHARSDGE